MHALLRSVWAEPRPPDPPHRVGRDWALLVLAPAAAVLEGVLRPDLPFRWVQVAVVCALAPLLLARRVRPLLVLAVALAALQLLALVTGDEQGMYAAVVVLLLPYAVVRWGSGRQALAGLALVGAAAAGSLLLGRASVGDAVGGLAVLLASVALGLAARYRARARSRELDQVASREREHLARDLHDTVAHHVSAIAIRAQAGLATAATRPDAATDALRLIEAEASTALTEMRGMVRVLRDGPAELSPAPGIADLTGLARAGDGGPAVEVEVVGRVDDVPAPIAATVHRVAQESVTNARRHARHATRIAVRVVADDEFVRLQVTDDGEPGAARGETGFGLLGMAERTHLLGGTFSADPDPGRGWTVRATLPRRGPA